MTSLSFSTRFIRALNIASPGAYLYSTRGIFLDNAQVRDRQ